MSAYYNELDPFAAAWLRELIKAGLIADGEVDERSIADVTAADVQGFTQCHFFAGIGGWSYALRLAGWSDERHVWTGSCPCQPFSAAGQGDGAADTRHLWPTWFRLIRESDVDAIFGEQVASVDGLAWLDLVHADLETAGYAIGAVDLCAAGIGAPHIRQRLYFVAHALSAGRPEGWPITGHRSLTRRSRTHALDNAERVRAGRSARSEGRAECAAPSDRQDEGRGFLQALDASADALDLAHAECYGRERTHDKSGSGTAADRQGPANRDRNAGPTGGVWADAEWLACRDGKARPVESGTFPLAYGIPGRVGRLRGYGNAIVPEVAQVFIEAYMSTVDSEADASGLERRAPAARA